MEMALFIGRAVCFNGNNRIEKPGECQTVRLFMSSHLELVRRRRRNKKRYKYKEGENRLAFLRRVGIRVLGYQLRYIYFLDQSVKERLTVPILPFSKIEEMGAGMYKGKPKRAGSIENDAPAFQREEGGEIPTPALHE